MILIDKITNVTLAHGVLRIECANVGASGEDAVSGVLAIPANRFADVLNQLSNSVRQLQQQKKDAASAGQVPPTQTEQ